MGCTESKTGNLPKKAGLSRCNPSRIKAQTTTVSPRRIEAACRRVFILNCHEEEASFFDQVEAICQMEGCYLTTTTTEQEYCVEQELEKHKWADVIILHCPVSWAGIPWGLEQYIGVVHPYLSGLCVGKHYLLSLSVDSSMDKSDALATAARPIHAAFQNLGMHPLPAFARSCHSEDCSNSSLGNPGTDSSILQFEDHLASALATAGYGFDRSQCAPSLHSSN